MTKSAKTSGQAKGGAARAKSLSAEERSEIAKKAAAARWNPDLPQATHEGVLHIGDIEIPCAVLADGQRLLTLSGVQQALGRARQAKGRKYYRDDAGLPVFMAAQNLKPFITNELLLASEYIEFRPLRGPRAFGFHADILPKLCDMFLDAEEANALTRQQQHIAARAKLLMRGLAHVGIIALVDEATGYQKVREHDELQKLLSAYVSPELLPWTQTFPQEFYDEMFRLRGWAWKPKKGRRPRLVGRLTNEIVYDRLPPDVVEELRRKNPVVKNGRRKDKNFQWLTEDVGHPILKAHLIGTIALMKATSTWPQFKRVLEKVYQKPGSVRQEEMFDGVDE